MKPHLLALVIAITPSLAQADMSAKKLHAPLAEDVYTNLLKVIADNAQADDTSPVKSGGRGIRNFQASNTVVRSALSYGILRAGGFDVSQDWAKSGEQIASALAFFDAKNQKNLEAAFAKLFGRALVKKRAGTGDQTRYSYDPAGLKAAFASVYVPPDATLGGARAQVVYDTLFRDWVAQRAETIALVLDRKGFLQQTARDLQAKASDPKFEGSMWQYALADKLPEPLKSEPRLIGTLVRRHADGTLPTVLELLRRVLGDYDPKTLERLGPRLKAPAV
jgi:hypothetical protein